jgi:hypothetical protein
MKLCLYADLCPTLLTSLDDSNTAKTTDANSHLNPNILPIIRVLQLFSLSQFHLCVTNSFLIVYLGVIDFSYFDVLSEPIIAAQLVQPKLDIFQPHILLCLATTVEVFWNPTLIMKKPDGRIFMGAKDRACIYEFFYQVNKKFCNCWNLNYVHYIGRGRIF